MISGLHFGVVRSPSNINHIIFLLQQNMWLLPFCSLSFEYHVNACFASWLHKGRRITWQSFLPGTKWTWSASSFTFGLKPVSPSLCSKRWPLTRHTFPCKPSQLSQLCIRDCVAKLWSTHPPGCCSLSAHLKLTVILLNRNSLEFSSVCGNRKGAWLQVFNMWWPMTWMWNACCISRVAGPSEQQRLSCPGPVSTRGTALLLTWARWVVLSLQLIYPSLTPSVCVCAVAPVEPCQTHAGRCEAKVVLNALHSE